MLRNGLLHAACPNACRSKATPPGASQQQLDALATNRDQYIGRLYNVTRATSLNINNCDWLATNCTSGDGPNHTNPCASSDVPMQDWFESPEMCDGEGGPPDVMPPGAGCCVR